MSEFMKIMAERKKKEDELKKSKPDETKDGLPQKKERKSIPRVQTPKTPGSVYDEFVKFCERSDVINDKNLLKHCTDKKKHYQSIVYRAIDTLIRMGEIK